MLIAKSETGYEANTKSQFQGNPGTREEFILTLIREVPIGVGYAVMLYVFEDLEQNEFAWFASKISQDFELNCTYRLKITVKAHRVFRGTKQTLFNRPKKLAPYIKPIEKPQDIVEGASVAEQWDAL